MARYGREMVEQLLADPRYEAESRAASHEPELPAGGPVTASAAAAAPAKATKAGVPAGDEISVPKILFLGVGLFVLTVLLLLGLSLIEHAG